MFGYIVDLFFCGGGLFLRILCVLICIPFTFINKKEQRFQRFLFLKSHSTLRSVDKYEKSRFSTWRMDLFVTGVLERTSVQNLFCHPQFLGS